MYLGGRLGSPWPACGGQGAREWTSPQRLTDDPNLEVFADATYYARCVFRKVLPHAARGPYFATTLAADGGSEPTSSDAIRRADGVNVARLDGSAEWRRGRKPGWKRAGMEIYLDPGLFATMDQRTCVALW